MILRLETEWLEIVDAGTAIIANADKEKIKSAFAHFQSNDSLEFPSIFGDGRAAEFICEQMLKFIPQKSER